MHNNQNYASVDINRRVNLKSIYSENNNKSVYAIDHMKWGGLEKVYDMKAFELALSMKRSGYIRNI